MSFFDASAPLVVNIVSAPRFCAFDLARELESLGYLGRLYTAFPKSKVRPHYQGQRVSTFPWLLGPYWVAGCIHWTGLHSELGWWLTDSFDRWAGRAMTPCTVIHALSSWSLYSGRAAKEKYDALVVYDRGSGQLRFEEELMSEEATLHGVARRNIDERYLIKDDIECALADIIIVPSAYALRTFVGRGVSAVKIHIVPLTANLALFKPSVKHDRMFRVIFAGRAGLTKGILYLLRAVEYLPRTSLECVIFGEIEPEMAFLLKKYRRIPNIRWRGAVPQTVLAEEMTQGSVLVLPSLSEGFGMVVAQAMACGLPVIVSENTGAADIVEDGKSGFIVPIRDVDAIRTKLLFLYENPAMCTDMGNCALHSLQALGSWNVYAKKLVEVYQSGLGELHRGRLV